MFLEHQFSILISEGSCDTEDWRNDPENSVLPSQKKNTGTFLNILKQF